MMLQTDFSPIFPKLGISGRRVGYEYEYNLEQLDYMLLLRGVREERGGVRAEICLERHRPGGVATLLRDTTTLTSMRSKSSLAKALAQRTEKDGWDLLVEAISNITIEDYREGAPFVRLADMENGDRGTYLIEKILPLDQATVLYGDGESCKSLTALYMGLAIASGARLPNLKLRGEPRPILYLDWETDWGAQRRRLGLACKGLQIPIPRDFHYRRMSRALAGDLRRIKHYVEEHGIGAVIVDSLISACGGDPTEPQPTIEFFNAGRELGGVTFLVIHHIPWSEAAKRDVPRLYGSIYIRNQVRSAWAVKRVKLQDKDYAQIGLYHNKSNDDRRYSAMALQYDFAEDQMSLRWLDPSRIADLSSGLTVEQQITALLRDIQPLSIADMDDDIAASKSTVARTVRRMVSDGDLVNLAPLGQAGMYALGAKGIEEVG
jgi:hypothetical protein